MPRSQLALRTQRAEGLGPRTRPCTRPWPLVLGPWRCGGTMHSSMSSVSYRRRFHTGIRDAFRRVDLRPRPRRLGHGQAFGRVGEQLGEYRREAICG